MLCLAGAWLLWDSYGIRHIQNVDIPSKTVTRSIGTPGETEPKEACEKYKVATGQPRKIIIEKIDVDGCIQRVGFDQNNAIAVPTNIHLAGWFVNSVVPGDKGNSIIDGHVLGRYNDAIFGRLKELRPKDTIKIQYGDGSMKSFTIEETQNYTVAEAGLEMFNQLPKVEKQLTLITCTGSYSSRTQTYDKRLIVRAAFID